MKKIITLIVAVLTVFCCVTAYAVVPNDDAYTTVIDWSSVAEDQINGGGVVSNFTDLSYWQTSSNGEQSLEDGKFVITTLEGDNNCYQFSLNSAISEENKTAWIESDAMRIYVDNQSGCEFYMTFYLYTAELGHGYGASYAMTNGYDVYLIYEENPGEIYEPDYRSDASFANRYFYIPDDFKGWIVVPNTFYGEDGDDMVGWMHSYWALGGDINFDYASMENATGLGVDIRAEEVDFDQKIVFGNLELVGQGDLFTAPSEDEIAGGSTDNNDNTEPTEVPSVDNNTDGGFPVWIIIAAAAVVVVVVIVVIVANGKKKAE